MTSITSKSQNEALRVLGIVFGFILIGMIGVVAMLAFIIFVPVFIKNLVIKLLGGLNG